MNPAIAFSIQGTLIDLNQGQVPNFHRSSQTWLESTVNDSVSLYPVKPFNPAFYREDGSFLLEPESVNLISNNQNMGIWTRGSNVFLDIDHEAPAADKTTKADRVIWASGDGTTQLIKRTFTLFAGKDYCFSAVIRLGETSRAGTKDVIRMTGDVVGTPQIALSTLNDYPGRDRILELVFKTAGNSPKLPNTTHNPFYAVTSVTSSTAVVVMPVEAIAAGQLKGAQVRFSNSSTNLYTVTDNTASVANSVALTFSSTSLITDGVTTTATALFVAPPTQTVSIEFYVESTLDVYITGLQLEERSFRTSMIFQDTQLTLRSACQLVYRRSPISRLKTCGVFLDLKEWRGDGNLFDLGNLSAVILNSKLVVKAGNFIFSINDNLPPQDVKIFVQVSSETNSVSVYVNKKLVAQTNLTFVGDRYASLDLTSLGVRIIRCFFTTDRLQVDGKPGLNENASEDVGALFDSLVPIDAVAISANSALTALNSVTIPAPAAPIAVSRVTAVGSGTNPVITVADGSAFVTSQSITVVRDGITLFRPRLNTKTGNDLTFDYGGGIIIGDLLYYGNAGEIPGRASVRFPFLPIDRQEITIVDAAGKRVKVASTLSFTTTKAFVQAPDPLYDEIAEVKVLSKDDATGYLTLDSVDSIAVGHTITQPRNEMLVDPKNYRAALLTTVDGVKINYCYTNGLELVNYTANAVRVQPCLEVHL